MTIPGYQDFMLPALRLGADAVVKTREGAEQLADAFGLSEAERAETLSDGVPQYQKRMAWAVVYLVKAGLVERPERGHYTATDEGRRVLATSPERIDNALLSQYPGFREFVRPTAPREADQDEPSAPETASSTTPEENIEAAERALAAELRAELISLVLARSPDDFEDLIVDLMVAMGYGAGGDNRRIGRSGDGGVDGIINEDRLGLDRVYLQAKRYAADNIVGPNQIREFAGALMLRNAEKGVFVTTSSFTRGAVDEAERMRQRIVLIDGVRLTELMVRHDVGVRLKRAVLIKEIDLNYFEDD